MYNHEDYLSPYTWRYGSEDMRQVWGEVNKRRLWRMIWVALAEVQSEFGLVTAEQLADLATRAGASQAAIACINDETYVPFVAATTQTGFSRGVGGTPTVLLNGRTLDNPFTDAELLALAGAQ